MGVYLGNYCCVMIIVLLVLGNEVSSQLLKNDYYSTSCPKAESIVRSTVESHFDSDPTISPGLLRLHFHDCFVQVTILFLNSCSNINLLLINYKSKLMVEYDLLLGLRWLGFNQRENCGASCSSESRSKRVRSDR